ncbi:mechanosensitive ion channel [Parahaliea maris]|uniref:Small-conductance mechanosensitive channel n=1 Tax=Parahaliea maris TaxID=2716870 RepID=A0A5C8ZME8_9GAMM|nr:mechanosensitive ion channel domain-containing protein [Parahaliea maris]TXS88934.1 mechanosensitive ion channel [Parahaliea maris]
MSEPESVAQSATADLIDTLPEVNALLAFFTRLDESDPLIRLLIAAALAGISVLLLLVSRFIVSRRLHRMADMPASRFRPLRWQAQDLVTAEEMQHFWMNVWRIAGWLLSLSFGVSALIGLLMTSDWTMDLAAHLMVMVLHAFQYVWNGFVGYLPNLATILVILLVARFTVRTIGLIFDGISSRRIHLRNFYPEWAHTSFGIIRLLIYALTAVIVFPYLPGSSSPAFQGISIFVGVLLSLGSTTAVANVVAGVVLTYTRAFQVGDQVEVGDVRGRIVERSTFVTRIQTLKNVIVSIPNSLVLNSNVINYSKNLGQTGLLVHSCVTIGYDVPWQRVSELLVAAAKRTENISSHPEPFVLQTSLDDNYVTYEVNGWTRKPEVLPRIYSDLHANILDEFHGHQVEITSPAYRAVRDGNTPNIPEVVKEEPESSEDQAVPPTTGGEQDKASS